MDRNIYSLGTNIIRLLTTGDEIIADRETVSIIHDFLNNVLKICGAITREMQKRESSPEFYAVVLTIAGNEIPALVESAMKHLTPESVIKPASLSEKIMEIRRLLSVVTGIAGQLLNPNYYKDLSERINALTGRILDITLSPRRRDVNTVSIPQPQYVAPEAIIDVCAEINGRHSPARGEPVDLNALFENNEEENEEENEGGDIRL